MFTKSKSESTCGTIDIEDMTLVIDGEKIKLEWAEEDNICQGHIRYVVREEAGSSNRLNTRKIARSYRLINLGA